MVFPLLLAAPMAPLELNLICPGEYLDEELTTGLGQTRDKNGNVTTGTVTVRKPVMRSGVAKVVFQGATGQLIYPDGRQRSLSEVATDERTITASYKRGLGLYTWRLRINRMTGEIEVKSGSTFGLTGVCAPAPPEPATPKF